MDINNYFIIPQKISVPAAQPPQENDLNQQLQNITSAIFGNGPDTVEQDRNLLKIRDLTFNPATEIKKEGLISSLFSSFTSAKPKIAHLPEQANFAECQVAFDHNAQIKSGESAKANTAILLKLATNPHISAEQLLLFVFKNKIRAEGAFFKNHKTGDTNNELIEAFQNKGIRVNGNERRFELIHEGIDTSGYIKYLCFKETFQSNANLKSRESNMQLLREMATDSQLSREQVLAFFHDLELRPEGGFFLTKSGNQTDLVELLKNGKGIIVDSKNKKYSTGPTRVNRAEDFDSQTLKSRIADIAKTDGYLCYYKTGDTEVFGNFAPVQLDVRVGEENWQFESVEAAFQCLKWQAVLDNPSRPMSDKDRADVLDFMRKIQGAGSADEVFRLSREIDKKFNFKLYPTNWKQIEGEQIGLRDHLMWALLKQKFEKSPYKELLLATEDAFLLEHNQVEKRDLYWSDNHNGEGENRLGQMHMMMRQMLMNGVIEERCPILGQKDARVVDFAKQANQAIEAGTLDYTPYT